jgi:hypothetical protein
MKKMLLTLALLGTATCVFGQGTIVYYNRIAGSVLAPVFAPEPGNPTLVLTGNNAAGFPVGSTVYNGLPLAGTGFTAELWAGPANTAEGALVAVPTSQKDFRTGGFAGAINNSGGIIAIPGVNEALIATLHLRVWDNAGGTITSYAAAVNGIRGASPVFQSSPLGGGAPPPNMVGLVSFNIHAPDYYGA